MTARCDDSIARKQRVIERLPIAVRVIHPRQEESISHVHVRLKVVREVRTSTFPQTDERFDDFLPEDRVIALRPIVLKHQFVTCSERNNQRLWRPTEIGIRSCSCGTSVGGVPRH